MKIDQVLSPSQEKDLRKEFWAYCRYEHPEIDPNDDNMFRIYVAGWIRYNAGFYGTIPVYLRSVQAV